MLRLYKEAIMPLFELRVKIGDIPVVAVSDREDFIRNLNSTYGLFLTQGNPGPFFKIYLFHNSLPDIETEVCLIQQEDDYLIRGMGFEGRVNLRKNTAEAVLPADERIFENFLRVFYSLLLLPNKGFLIHSLGLERDGKGYLFVGPSSSGKSTTAGNAADFKVMSDELMIARQVEGKFYLFSTPFAGDYRGKISALRTPLKRILFLSKELPMSYKPLKKMEKFISLLENIFFFARDLQSNEKIIALCNNLCSSVAGYQMNIFAERNIRRLMDEISESDNTA
ncbi:MAG: hypothetical protein ABH914_04995 [Candidatus Omnitrophota bacterium]